jgi:nucleotide-binding universal stress UspA family protein
MYRSALIALSTEGGNEDVSQMALDLAVQQHLQLSAITVVDSSTVAPAEAVPLGATAFKERHDDALKTQAHERGQQELAAFGQRCGALDLRCSTALREGHLDQEIAIAAQTCDMLVVGHGDGTEACGETREDLSKLHSMLGSCGRACLVVPCHAGEIRRVVVAYDGSLQAARAVHDFAVSGLWRDCPVDVVSQAADSQEAAETAERAVGYLRTHDYAAEAHPIVAKFDAADHILEYVKESGAGVLVMGVYGKPRWHKFFVGTVTRSILRATNVPVFVSH